MVQYITCRRSVSTHSRQWEAYRRHLVDRRVSHRHHVLRQLGRFPHVSQAGQTGEQCPRPVGSEGHPYLGNTGRVLHQIFADGEFQCRKCSHITTDNCALTKHSFIQRGEQILKLVSRLG